MTRIRKSLEEQLAAAQAKKERAAARLNQLEIRRKQRDARMRAWGEKVLVGAILNVATAQPNFKAVLEDLLATADLNSKEREAALWLLANLEPAQASASTGSTKLGLGISDLLDQSTG
jgi:hypothetical protein